MESGVLDKGDIQKLQGRGASRTMKVFLRHKDLHTYGKICESVHKTANVN